MNTKFVAILVLAAGSGVLGAAIYFSGSEKPDPGVPVEKQSPSTASGVVRGSLGDDQGSLRDRPPVEPAIKEVGHVIGKRSSEKSGWAAMLDRMGEFDMDGDGILNDLEKMAMGVRLKNEWMDKYDLDGDGEISAEEMEAFQVEQFINSDWGQDMMRQFDANNDGILNADEEAALRAHLEDLEEQKRAEELAQLDTDGDGQISREERKVQRQQQREWWNNTMQSATERYDRDGDGVLNIEESQDAWNGWIAEQSLSDFIRRYDSDSSGAMDSSDYQSFLIDYQNGDMSADVNRDGVLNTLDLTAFTDLTNRVNNQP